MTASLANRTWPEADSSPLLVVPVGATEQHGPHLPLTTDTDIAIALALRLAERVPGALVAPAVAYGASGEHEGFAGTLSIGREATEWLLVELGRSACATFDRFVLVSTHGGNAEPVARAVERLRGEGRAVLAWSPAFDGDAHAGRVETSLMMALRPDRVGDHQRVTGNVAPLLELWPELRSKGVRAVSPSGVLGDPADASADEGRELLDAAADDLVEAVARWMEPR